jgi:hypothetical protein
VLAQKIKATALYDPLSSGEETKHLSNSLYLFQARSYHRSSILDGARGGVVPLHMAVTKTTKTKSYLSGRFATWIAAIECAEFFQLPVTTVKRAQNEEPYKISAFQRPQETLNATWSYVDLAFLHVHRTKCLIPVCQYSLVTVEWAV